jgi:four helix bundle protein
MVGLVMEQRAVELKERTKRFALRVIRVSRALPACAEGRVIGGQLLRSGTSVAANYRAVCRARSRAEFLAKIGLVIEEADETAFWLELLSEAGLIRRKRLEDLISEANQLTAIFVASRETAKKALQSTIKNQQSKIRTKGSA